MDRIPDRCTDPWMGRTPGTRPGQSGRNPTAAIPPTTLSSFATSWSVIQSSMCPGEGTDSHQGHSQTVGPSTGPAQGSSPGPSTAQSACAVSENIHSSNDAASIFLFNLTSLVETMITIRAFPLFQGADARPWQGALQLPPALPPTGPEQQRPQPAIAPVRHSVTPQAICPDRGMGLSLSPSTPKVATSSPGPA